MSIRFFIQNVGWSVLNPSQAYKAKKAMDVYRKLHPFCEITGSNKNIQVHHIIPVFANPQLADSLDNMISLSTSANIHLIYGHNGDFGAKYVSNIKKLAEDIKSITSTANIVFKQDITTLNAKQQNFYNRICILFAKVFKRKD